MIKTFTLVVEYTDYESLDQGYMVHKNISRATANEYIEYYKMHFHNVKVSLTTD